MVPPVQMTPGAIKLATPWYKCGPVASTPTGRALHLILQFLEMLQYTCVAIAPLEDCCFHLRIDKRKHHVSRRSECHWYTISAIKAHGVKVQNVHLIHMRIGCLVSAQQDVISKVLQGT